MPGRNLTRPQFTKAAERIYFYGDDDDDVNDDYDYDNVEDVDDGACDAWLPFDHCHLRPQFTKAATRVDL